jgi:hypothetical protein
VHCRVGFQALAVAAMLAFVHFFVRFPVMPAATAFRANDACLFAKLLKFRLATRLVGKLPYKIH